MKCKTLSVVTTTLLLRFRVNLVMLNCVGRWAPICLGLSPSKLFTCFSLVRERDYCLFLFSFSREVIFVMTFTFTFMHLADAFIQSDLQLHSGYTFSLVCVFPGNRTHNLLRC